MIKAGAAWDVERHGAQAISPERDQLFADNTRFGTRCRQLGLPLFWAGSVRRSHLIRTTDQG